MVLLRLLAVAVREPAGGRQQQRAGAGVRGRLAGRPVAVGCARQRCAGERRQRQPLGFERHDQLTGVGVALRRVLGERSQDDRV